MILFKMIFKLVLLPFSLGKNIIGFIFKIIKTIFSTSFGIVRFVINRVFGTVFGALIGFFIGSKTIARPWKKDRQ